MERMLFPSAALAATFSMLWTFIFRNLVSEEIVFAGVLFTFVAFLLALVVLQSELDVSYHPPGGHLAE